MGRRAEGWKLRAGEGGVWNVRFRHEGRRYEFSTGTTDPGGAAKAAAQKYAEVISGRWRPVIRFAPGVPLDRLFTLWIVDIESSLDPETVKTYKGYARGLFIPYFGTLGAMTRESIHDYSIARLASVIRRTILKERSALRGFLEWAEGRHLVDSVPEFRRIPKKSTGTRSGPQRAKPIDLTEKQVDLLIAALPERSRRKGYPVRARLRVAYETSLRPATIAGLRVPANYHRGATHLEIEDEIDKNRFGRRVPLSARARAALDAVTPDVGTIFGKHDLRHYVKAAAKQVGLPAHVAEKVASYDLRHARAQHLVDAGADLTAVQFLMGHTQLTTMNKYVRASEKGAERMVAKFGGRSPKKAPRDVKKRPQARR